jgi:hypothetical protein
VQRKKRGERLKEEKLKKREIRCSGLVINGHTIIHEHTIHIKQPKWLQAHMPLEGTSTILQLDVSVLLPIPLYV